jgi:hypothetical protein
VVRLGMFSFFVSGGRWISAYHFKALSKGFFSVHVGSYQRHATSASHSLCLSVPLSHCLSVCLLR